MTDYQKSGRVDLAILDVLARRDYPLALNAIHKKLCAEQSWVSIESLASHAKKLVLDGCVAMNSSELGNVPLYFITAKGRAHSIAEDSRLIMGERLGEAAAATEPLQVSVCNHTEPPDLDEPAQALLCVDEDELNDWWNALDVEAKADAFVQWSLGNDGRNSHIYIERNETVSVPVTGKVGDDDETAAFLHKRGKMIAEVVREAIERQKAATV